MAKTIIISGCNDAYYPLLDGLLSSIDFHVRSEGIDIGVLDVGLSDAQRQSLEQRNIKLATPPWDYQLNFANPAPTYFKTLTARPHLPQHFPGYDIYFWIDADCWVQDWDAAKLYLTAAASMGFSCTPECDRSYNLQPSDQITPMQWAHSCFARHAGEQIAKRLFQYPIVNGGIFAARADAPHWKRWSTTLGEYLSRLRAMDFLVEQTALNVVIRTCGYSTAFLPARCNWQCGRATPVLSGDGTEFLEPQPPYAPIGILHLTSNTKDVFWTAQAATGAKVYHSLRYGGAAGSGTPPAPTIPPEMRLRGTSSARS